MALPKQMLRLRGLAIAAITERMGYRSVSTFGVAFTRHVGVPPGHCSKIAIEG